MDGEQINQKIRYGYAKAASKLGSDFVLYRSAVPINPIQDGNIIGTVKVAPSQDWTWMKGNRPGNAIWYLCVDGQEASEPLSAQEGDYLVGMKTFFILSKEYQLPIQGVECNKIVDIRRPSQSTAAGYSPGAYAAYVEADSALIMREMPISMLLYRIGSRAESKLPTDTLQPSWICMLPNLGDVDLRTGDFMIGAPNADNLPGIVETNDRFVISGTEETEFGWRVTCMQMMN